jgi:hypothetical protein
MFVPRKVPVTGNPQTITTASDLAERIVDEISEADQDWRAIELDARELVELLTRLRGVSPRQCDVSG